MLKNNMKEYFSLEIAKQKSTIIETYKDEIDYEKKYQLLENNYTLSEKEPNTRFTDAYIERSDKETEELLGEERASFLEHPVNYLKVHKNEFIYLESEWFTIISADSVCLEVDDLFGTYEVMLGLKLQKKYEGAIKSYLTNKLIGEKKFSLLFSQADGLWDFNFALTNVAGFHEEMTIGEAYRLIYSFLFKLMETVEEG